jgi:hypothetical protein
LRIQPVILGVGIVASIWWAVDAPMVREIGGVVMACDPAALFGDGCQRDSGAMALRFVMGMGVSSMLAGVGGRMLRKKDEVPDA